MRFNQMLSSLFTLLLCASVTLAQSGRKVSTPLPPRALEDSPDAIRINTVEVQLAVTVRDSLGQAVRGLQAEDFSIYDNGKRYEAVHFEYRHVPANVVLLLDGATGIFEDRESIRQSLIAFRRKLAPNDRLAVLQFTDELLLTQDWCNDEVALRKALQPALPAKSKAALTDALALAAAKLSQTQGQRIILLLTSGFNTASLTDFTAALRSVQNAGVTVYVYSQTEALAVAMRQLNAQTQSGDDVTALKLAQLKLTKTEAELTALAETSGGKIFFPLQESSLRWMLAETAVDLRGLYLLTYQPAEERAGLNRQHLIHVTVRTGHQTFARANAEWPARQKTNLSKQFILAESKHR